MIDISYRNYSSATSQSRYQASNRSRKKVQVKHSKPQYLVTWFILSKPLLEKGLLGMT